MTKKVIEIPAKELDIAETNKPLRVAAYCRVSTDKDEQQSSLEMQVKYFTEKIEGTPNWKLAGIFTDEGISGTTDKKRPEFMRMVRLCQRGGIDRILTKSISRFSRNTVDCLSWVRKLKALGISVLFEKEGIDTAESIGETFLTWFSAFAQAESESISQNVTWGVRKGFKEDNHPAIVTKEVFRQVQEEMQRRASTCKLKEKTSRYSSKYALTGKVIYYGGEHRRDVFERNAARSTAGPHGRTGQRRGKLCSAA